MKGRSMWVAELNARCIVQELDLAGRKFRDKQILDSRFYPDPVMANALN